jgi:hypothetical protein
MAEEFQYDLQLAQMQMRVTKSKEAEVEDRKDKRTKIQATQQSKMIDQRKNDLLPTNFEAGDTGAIQSPMQEPLQPMQQSPMQGALPGEEVQAAEQV